MPLRKLLFLAIWVNPSWIACSYPLIFSYRVSWFPLFILKGSLDLWIFLILFYYQCEGYEGLSLSSWFSFLLLEANGKVMLLRVPYGFCFQRGLGLMTFHWILKTQAKPGLTSVVCTYKHCWGTHILPERCQQRSSAQVFFSWDLGWGWFVPAPGVAGGWGSTVWGLAAAVSSAARLPNSSSGSVLCAQNFRSEKRQPLPWWPALKLVLGEYFQKDPRIFFVNPSKSLCNKKFPVVSLLLFKLFGVDAVVCNHWNLNI